MEFAINSENRERDVASGGSSAEQNDSTPQHAPSRGTDKTPEQIAREQKIAALKRAIESGTYRVESDKVAEAIITEFANRNK